MLKVADGKNLRVEDAPWTFQIVERSLCNVTKAVPHLRQGIHMHCTAQWERIGCTRRGGATSVTCGSEIFRHDIDRRTLVTRLKPSVRAQLS